MNTNDSHTMFTIVGSITVKNAQRALEGLGFDVNEQVVASLATDDDDGLVEFETFSYFAGSKLVLRAKALRAFELFDKDGKGLIILEDLQRVAMELDENMSERDLEEMLDDADKEGQGFLSKEDFLSVAETLNL